jgi:hypothetical protein
MSFSIFALVGQRLHVDGRDLQLGLLGAGDSAGDDGKGEQGGNELFHGFRADDADG